MALPAIVARLLALVWTNRRAIATAAKDAEQWIEADPDDSQPLTWRDVEHQREQERAATAHKVKR